MHKKKYPPVQYLINNPLICLLALMLIVVLGLFFQRHLAYKQLCALTEHRAITRVQTINAKPTDTKETIALPGMVLAWHEAPIYARSKGYLKEWYVDIGDKVKKGDVLAVIERPELQAELHEAEDYLKVVSAQYELAKITAKRWSELVKTDSVSKQAYDNKRYDAAAYLAELRKARSNLEKLRAFVSFDKIIAPFDGVISLRQTDIGALINIGSHPIETKPLFKMVQTDPLRLYVNIPQMYSSRIQSTKKVSLRFAEHPGKTFSARLIKTAGAIDTSTLTLQAEFAVDNKQGILLPGSYTMVEFSIPNTPDSVILPANTLIFRAKGLQVAVVEKNRQVTLKKIEIGTDFGKKVQVNSVIKPGEQIVINPPDSLYNGEHVEVVNEKRRPHSSGERKSLA